MSDYSSKYQYCKEKYSAVSLIFCLLICVWKVQKDSNNSLLYTSGLYKAEYKHFKHLPATFNGC